MAAPPAAPDTRPAADALAGGRSAAPRRSPLATFLRASVAGQTWRAYLYLLVAAPLALAAFVALAVFAWLGVLLSLTLVGIPVLALIVLGAREYGAVPRALARGLLGEPVEAPRRRQPKSVGFFAWLRALVVTPRAVEKHVGNIFAKLDLPESDTDHRRVLAVLRYLRS